jgi:hypothetical protein
MIMSKDVIRMLAHDLGVKPNRLRVVFDAEVIVRANIADLLLDSARTCDARNTY